MLVSKHMINPKKLNFPQGPNKLSILLQNICAGSIVKIYFGVLPRNLKKFDGFLKMTMLRNELCYLISDPQAIRHVCQTNYSNYLKHGKLWEKIRLILGDSNLGAVGDGHWRELRGISLSGFAKNYMQNYAPLIIDKIYNYPFKFKQPFDMAREMVQLTMEIILETTCNYHISKSESKMLAKFITFSLDNLLHRSNIFDSKYIPSISNYRFHRLRAKTDKLIETIIANFKHNPTNYQSVMHKLLDADIPHRILLDEVLALVLAGHETTACTLTWAWYSLLSSPNCLDTLIDEIQTVAKGRKIDANMVSQMPYLQAVYHETMRLYPAIPILYRVAMQDDKINGYDVPAGTNIMLHIAALHRDEKYWDNPLQFIPERFLNKSPMQFKGYFPFGIGPRICLGMNFANLEVPLVLAILLQKHKFELVDKKMPETNYGMSYRTKNLILRQTT